MQVWILRPKEGLGIYSPWEPWYDKVFCFVVRAETEEAAREFADKNAGDENRGNAVWLDPQYTTCVPLTDDGDAGIIIKEFASA